jgi:hypothetical protein
MVSTSWGLSAGFLLAWALSSVLSGGVESHLHTSTSSAQSSKTEPVECLVTQPNGATYTIEPAGGNHGNEALVTWLWPAGKVVFKPGGPGSVLSDGALSMKFGWWRRLSGPLTLEGRRVDGDAPAMRSSIPSGYGDHGFQSTALIFPTPGCWQVTGRVGGGSLTLVVLVEKIGDGPARGALH